MKKRKSIKISEIFIFITLLFILAGCSEKDNSSSDISKSINTKSYSFAKIGNTFNDNPKYGDLTLQDTRKEGLLEYNIYIYRLGDWQIIYYVNEGNVHKVSVNPHIDDSAIPYTLEQFEQDKTAFIPDDAKLDEVKENNVDVMPKIYEHYSSEQITNGFVITREYFSGEDKRISTYSIEIKE